MVNKETKTLSETKCPPLWIALTPIIILIVLLSVTIRIFGSDALSGGSQISLLIATAITAIIGITSGFTTWTEIEANIGESIKGIATALVILLLIGALSGSWMISGVTPTLIYYGMQILSPLFFLPCCCIICAIVSVMTGSSWTTIATIGVALLGIGHVMGYADGWVAGCIISGAYFGDKMSPLSDTTVLASSTTGTPLFTHIRYMMYTTVPSLMITLLVFLVAGLFRSTDTSIDSLLFSETLRGTFHISAWLMVVPLISSILIIKRAPSLITLFVSAISGAIAALIAQPNILSEIGRMGAQSGDINQVTALFKGTYITLFGATNITSGMPVIDELISTHGMGGMLNTVWLIVCAMTFGAALTANHSLESIMHHVKKIIGHRFNLITSTVFTGIFGNITMGDQFISIILTGRIFKTIYENEGYESRLLSRAIEDSSTVTAPLIPWTTGGMTQATILGVATWTYFPYCIFNIVSPIMSIIVTSIGYKVYRHKETPSQK